MDIPAAEQIARLLAQVESLSRDNERLAADNARLARDAAEAARVPAGLERELREELAAVKAERDRLVEMVKLANQRFSGCRSERVVPDQLSLFNDVEAAADPGAAEPEFSAPARPRRRGGRRMEASPRMALDAALRYAVEYWPYAMNVLDDGRLELDNNLAERAIKPFVIGRKNFLFSDAPRGAEASAGIYSVVTTAKANGLNPRKYLEWLLTEMPNAADPDDPAYLDSLMPWSDSVPEEIKLTPVSAAEAARMADDPFIDIDPSAFSEDEK